MPSQADNKLLREIKQLQSDMASLQSAGRLSRLHDEVEDLTTTINGLGQQLRDLRSRGYPFERALESKAEAWAQQWVAQREELTARIDREALALQGELRSVESLVRQAVNGGPDEAAVRPLLRRAQTAVETLESKAGAVQDNIRGMFDGLKRQIDELVRHLRQVEWTLGQLGEATFRLLPSEAGVMAVKARWVKGSKDDPRGVLFLTDQRLLFEQKEELATKKVLFVTTQKQKVQELLLDVPVGQIQKVLASSRGLLGHEDHIELDLTAEAPVPKVHFHLDGQDSKRWQALIGRVQSGDLDVDRAVPVDQEAVQKARQAPTRCPNCNAPLTQTVLRGMDTIQCEYCGHTIRL